LFVSRPRGDLIKVSGRTQGMCLFVKRLERGRLHLASPAEVS
jgi:hypothetical protein